MNKDPECTPPAVRADPSPAEMSKPAPAVPALLANRVDPTPAPTMASGNGCLSEGDWKKTPFQVMNEHEARIREYFKTLDRKDVVQHLKAAARHPLYQKYLSQCSPSKRFGEKGVDDVVEYDMWLKKLEIAERRAAAGVGNGKDAAEPSPPKPVVPPSVKGPAKPVAPPSEPPTPPVSEPPKPATPPSEPPTPPVSAPPKPATPPTEPPKPADPPTSVKEEETESNKEAYDQFWSKFKAPAAKVQKFDFPAAAGTPTTPSPVHPSPSSHQGSSNVTPACKKRLELEGEHRWKLPGCV